MAAKKETHPSSGGAAASPVGDTPSTPAGVDGVQAETAAMLRRLLEAVERGELAAGGARGVALVHRLEGAVVALEGAAGSGGTEAAALIRGLIDAVGRGELGPGGQEGVALVRRMEGAAVALEATAG